MPNPPSNSPSATAVGFAEIAAATVVDTLVRKHVSHCNSLAEWVLSCKGGYRPTLLTSKRGAIGAELFILAEAFDECARRMGREIVAFRQ